MWSMNSLVLKDNKTNGRQKHHKIIDFSFTSHYIIMTSHIIEKLQWPKTPKKKMTKKRINKETISRSKKED